MKSGCIIVPGRKTTQGRLCSPSRSRALWVTARFDQHLFVDFWALDGICCFYSAWYPCAMRPRPPKRDQCSARNSRMVRIYSSVCVAIAE
jgi:hypothetical protein